MFLRTIRAIQTARLRQPSLALLLIVALALLLAWMMFIVHLDLESMWSDEWFSWMYAVQGPLALVRGTALDVHPPPIICCSRFGLVLPEARTCLSCA